MNLRTVEYILHFQGVASSRSLSILGIRIADLNSGIVVERLMPELEFGSELAVRDADSGATTMKRRIGMGKPIPDMCSRPLRSRS